MLTGSTPSFCSYEEILSDSSVSNNSSHIPTNTPRAFHVVSKWITLGVFVGMNGNWVGVAELGLKKDTEIFPWYNYNFRWSRSSKYRRMRETFKNNEKFSFTKVMENQVNK